MSKELPNVLQILLKAFLEEISQHPYIKELLEEIKAKLIELKDGTVTPFSLLEKGSSLLSVEFEQDIKEFDKLEDDFFIAADYAKNTTRFYSEDEQNILGAKKIGTLMMLEHMGIINPIIREKIIYALVDLDDPYCEQDDFFLIIAEAIKDSATPEQALVLTKILEDYSLSIQH